MPRQSPYAEKQELPSMTNAAFIMPDRTRRIRIYQIEWEDFLSRSDFSIKDLLSHLFMHLDVKHPVKVEQLLRRKERLQIVLTCDDFEEVRLPHAGEKEEDLVPVIDFTIRDGTGAIRQ